MCLCVYACMRVSACTSVCACMLYACMPSYVGVRGGNATVSLHHIAYNVAASLANACMHAFGRKTCFVDLQAVYLTNSEGVVYVFLTNPCAIMLT